MYKQKHPPSLSEFNRILDKISNDDRIGRLFIVDIKLHDINTRTGAINSFRYQSKAHSTLAEKKIIPLSAEDLHFLFSRSDWLVTHIYEYYTFEQEKFKKEFVAMNQ